MLQKSNTGLQLFLLKYFFSYLQSYKLQIYTNLLNTLVKVTLIWNILDIKREYSSDSAVRDKGLSESSYSNPWKELLSDLQTSNQ